MKLHNTIGKKFLSSIALSAGLVASAGAAEATPFGFIGAYYSQGTSGMPVDNGKQAGYASVAAHLGLDVGFGSGLSFGVGAWGAFPFYQNYFGIDKTDGVGDRVFPNTWEVSDLYVKYDNSVISVAGGRFDVGRFYHGVNGKEYTGMDYLWGNIQGVAFNLKASSFGFWALWMNSKLGVNGNYNRMSYELASFNNFVSWKHGHKGEVFMSGLDFDFQGFKLSPFAFYDTNIQNNATTGSTPVLTAGAKAVIDVSVSGFESITTIRGLWQDYKIAGVKNNPLMLWIDEELIFAEIFKFGAGYIANNQDSVILYGNDKSRFYGYRSNAPYGHTSPIYYGGKTGIWYVFAGIKPDSRLELDLLASGGDYDEYSAVLSFRFFGDENAINGKLGGGFVSTRPGWADEVRSRNNAIAFVKFSF